MAVLLFSLFFLSVPVAPPLAEESVLDARKVSFNPKALVMPSVSHANPLYGIPFAIVLLIPFGIVQIETNKQKNIERKKER